MLQSEEHERGISPVEGSDPKSFQQPCSGDEGAFTGPSPEVLFFVLHPKSRLGGSI